MPAVWQNDGGSWKLLNPASFPAEAALHDLVAASPELLPLLGKPRLAVLGREVQLGSGYADILAVEDSGRLVVIEVKLARNSEARRAVVAQVLAYAAYLQGMDAAGLTEVLGQGLGGATLVEAVSRSFGDDLFDKATWEQGLHASLAEGWFRLVLVLDEVPEDLSRLVGYLERVTDERLAIDLVSVSSYAVNGAQVVVPQRIDSSSHDSGRRMRAALGEPSTRQRGPSLPGAASFEEFISEVAPEHRESLAALTQWAKRLESAGFARLTTSIGNGRRVLKVLVVGEDVGIAAFWAEKRRPGVSFHLSVAGRRAPDSVDKLRALLPAVPNPYLACEEISTDVLEALWGAYQEASVGRILVSDGGNSR